MKRHFASLVVLAAFALAPLAHAVDCLMHTPADNTGVHSHAEHHEHSMPVAACFDAAMDAVQVDASVFQFAAVVALGAETVNWVRPAMDRGPIQLAYMWRGPPPDIFLMSPRRRI